jgi:hypothetical protein
MSLILDGTSGITSPAIPAAGAIGGTTPAAGAFTTVSATGLISPSQTVGIVGTTTNNSAQAGSIGEYISSSVIPANAVATASNTPVNVTSISLTAGDWDVRGRLAHAGAGTNNYTQLKGSITTSSASYASADAGAVSQGVPVNSSVTDPVFPLPTVRFSLSSTTTIYLVSYSVWTGSTLGSYGEISARRMR